MFSELPFYEELSVIKTDHAFKEYAMSYKVELVEKKDLVNQLEASKSSIKDFFNELLDETKGFKYQITLKVELKKYKGIEMEFSPDYFNSTAKTVINHRFSLNKSFQEILYRTDNWINESSGWIIESIESQYSNVSTFRPLIQSYYVKLPAELRSPKEGLINIKNNNQKCFLWCHIKHINQVKIHPKRITQKDKELVNDLNYDGIEFPVSGKIFSKIETKKNICINVFCDENKLTFPIYISDQ